MPRLRDGDADHPGDGVVAGHGLVNGRQVFAFAQDFTVVLAGAVLFPLMRPPGVKLFQCMQPVPDTVVQIGPYRAVRAPRPDSLR